MSHLRTGRTGWPVWLTLGALAAGGCQQVLGLDAYDVTYTAGGSSGAGGSGGKASGGDAGDDAGGSSSGGKGGKGGNAGSAGSAGSEAGAAGEAGTGGTAGTAGAAGTAGTSGTAGTAGTGGVINSPCDNELLQNGNFEQGDAVWIYTSTQNLESAIANQADILNVDAVTPPFLAWMGGWEDPAADPILTDIQSLSQVVTIPANATLLTVSGYALVKSVDSAGGVYDTLDIALVDLGTPLVYFSNLPPDGFAFTNQDTVAMNVYTWMPFEFSTDAMPYQGLELTFELSAFSDETLFTHFYLDSLSLCPTP